MNLFEAFKLLNLVGDFFEIEKIEKEVLDIFYHKIASYNSMMLISRSKMNLQGSLGSMFL